MRGHYSLTTSKENSTPKRNNSPSYGPSLYEKQLSDTLLEGLKPRILSFQAKTPSKQERHKNRLQELYAQSPTKTTPSQTHKTPISTAPERVLDAPDMLNDYYLNLLDWNKNNVLAVVRKQARMPFVRLNNLNFAQALGQIVYLWDAGTSEIVELCNTMEDNFITSLSWIKEGNYLAIGKPKLVALHACVRKLSRLLGTNACDVQIWDVESQRMLRSMRGHEARVGSLAWNDFVLSSGSRDSQIFNHDVRIAQHHVQTMTGHTQEVCGLRWSPDGQQLASGGNDNLLNIWDVNGAQQHTMNDHLAAVKALAWCPWQSNLLCSGGGTADRHLRFWNTQTGACVEAIDTMSQVCAVRWNEHDKELVSSHGFSQNQLCVWKFPSMTKIAELTGHTGTASVAFTVGFPKKGATFFRASASPGYVTRWGDSLQCRRWVFLLDVFGWPSN